MTKREFIKQAYSKKANHGRNPERVLSKAQIAELLYLASQPRGYGHIERYQTASALYDRGLVTWPSTFLGRCSWDPAGQWAKLTGFGSVVAGKLQRNLNSDGE